MKIRYEVTDAAGKRAGRSIPFTIGVLADCSAGRAKERLRDRKFQIINQDNFEKFMEQKSSQVELSMSAPGGGPQTGTTISLCFRTLVDFEPHSIANQIPQIAEWLMFRQSFDDLIDLAKNDYNIDDVVRELILSPDIRADLESGEAQLLSRLPCWIQATSRLSFERFDKLKCDLSNFVRYDKILPITGVREPIVLLRIMLDHCSGTIQDFINSIISHPDVRSNEACWRSLQYLVDEVAKLNNVRIVVLDCLKKELTRDIKMASDVTQSSAFKLLIDHNFGSFGEFPLGIVIGDFSINCSPDDMAFLTGMSEICELGLCGFGASASPSFFDVDSFGDIHKPRELASLFRRKEYALWNEFRNLASARYVVLTLPRLLLRFRYDGFNFLSGSFSFSESAGPHVDSPYLWGNAAFALAIVAARSVDQFGWFSSMRGVERGGLSDDADGQQSESRLRLRVETKITDSRATELLNLGFTPVFSVEASDSVGFAAFASCYRRILRPNGAGNGREQLAANYQALLAFSRLAHHLKAYCQERVSSELPVAGAADMVKAWLQTIDFSGSLLESSVEVEIRPPEPGARECLVEIRARCSQDSAHGRFDATLKIPFV